VASASGEGYDVAKSKQPTVKKPAAQRRSQSATPSATQKRLAAQRAMAVASGRRSARRRRLWWQVGAPIVAVVVTAGIVVAVAALHHPASKVNHTPVAITSMVQSQVTGVPASVIDAVGTGSGLVKAPSKLSGPTLTADGKPRVLYVGAEYCPYCAAERWGLVNALSRFGTFTGLTTTYSSATDVDPDTATLDLHGASYTSTYISLTAKEIRDGDNKPLDTLDAADNSLFTSIGGSGFPFIDIGGKYAVTGESYDPGILKGKSHAQIAAAMSDPNSRIGQATVGLANYLTAAICASTTNQPTTVCTAAGVTAAGKALGGNGG